MSQLIELIKTRITDPMRATEGASIAAPHIYPPATLAAIQAEEQKLGFELPTLLKQIYLEVGNGGFGPGYGLIGVAGGAIYMERNIAGLYQSRRRERDEDPIWDWPEKLVPICHLGCGMLACSDCRDDAGRIIWYEPNPRENGDPLDLFLIPLAGSLEAWLTAWLDDRDLTAQAYLNSELKKRMDEGTLHP